MFSVQIEAGAIKNNQLEDRVFPALSGTTVRRWNAALLEHRILSYFTSDETRRLVHI